MSSQAAEKFPSSLASINDRRVTPYKNGVKFWIMFASMCTCVFLATLEASSLSTALPTIAWALNTSQFTWFGSAYSLASTAFVPMSSGLARAFGRRPATLIAIGLFVVGSGICGCTNTMEMLIVGRIIQGFGGGGIQSLTGIILADIVSLQECGIYAALYGL